MIEEKEGSHKNVSLRRVQEIRINEYSFKYFFLSTLPFSFLCADFFKIQKWTTTTTFDTKPDLAE